MLPMLPAELIDWIFSFLQEDIPALKACSNAHPSLSRFAEQHIYANLVVETVNQSAVAELHKLLSENPHILDYPRTLVFRTYGIFEYSPVQVLSILTMAPRFANLRCLKLVGRPCTIDLFQRFLITFKNFLRQTSIEELLLSYFYDFPLSVLDNAEKIRKLTLSGFLATEEKHVLTSGSPPRSFDTLIIGGETNPDLYWWAMLRVSRLTTLELLNVVDDNDDWIGCPELLLACSNSLKRLQLDLGDHCHTQSSVYPEGHSESNIWELLSSLRSPKAWIADDLNFPFTLSALKCLEKLYIFALVRSAEVIDELTIQSALSAIMRLLKTLPPSIQGLVLNFHFIISDITPLGKLDWSPLGNIQSDFAGVFPCIDFRISGEDMAGLFSAGSVLHSLAGNESMTNLVKRGVVTLRSAHPAELARDRF